MYGIGIEGCSMIIDTMDTYLNNFFPGLSKNDIKELDLSDYSKYGSVEILDINGINELVNLEKLAIVGIIYDGEGTDILLEDIDFQKFPKLKELSVYNCSLIFSDVILDLKNTNIEKLSIDAGSVRYQNDKYEENIEFIKVDITNMKNLKEFEYKFEDYYKWKEEGDIRYAPELEKNIITDDYSKIKYKEEKCTSEYTEWLEIKYFIGADEEQDDVPTEKKEYIKNEIIKEKDLNGNSVISGLKVNQTVEDFLNEDNFKEGYEVKVVDLENNEIVNTEILGTGNKINLYKDGNLVKEYVIIIYGDTDGDGKIESIDALTLIKLINEKIELKDPVYLEAGKVTGEEKATAVDALTIVKSLNGKAEIKQDI